MILKVQISRRTNAKVGPSGWRLLVYDESREISFEGPCPTAVSRAVFRHPGRENSGAGDMVKAFFEASLVHDQVCIEGPAPWQDW